MKDICFLPIFYSVDIQKLGVFFLDKIKESDAMYLAFGLSESVIPSATPVNKCA